MNADELTFQSTEIEFSSADQLEKKRLPPTSEPDAGFESAYVHEGHAESAGGHELSATFLPEEHRAKKIKTDPGESVAVTGLGNEHGNGDEEVAKDAAVLEEEHVADKAGGYKVNGSIVPDHPVKLESLESVVAAPPVPLHVGNMDVSVPTSPTRAKSPQRSPSPPRPIVTVPDSPKKSVEDQHISVAHDEMDVEIVEPPTHSHVVTEQVSTAEQRKEMLLALQLKWAANTVRAIKRAHDSVPFQKPVDPVALGIPDYFNVIKNPMDLSTIERKLQSKEYANIEAFVADMELMLHNCFTYNPPSHPVHIMGRSVEKIFKTNHLPKIPQEGDELKPQFKNDKFSAPSPVINRPKRDVHPPSEFPFEDRKRGRLNDDLRWCQKIHNELLKKQYYSFMFPFYQPVDPVALNIPQYFDVIKNPMDLSTMKKKLDMGEYQSAAEYEADFRQMIQNCYTFNRPGDAVYMMGQRSEELFGRKWAEKPTYKERDSFGVSSQQRGKKKKSFAGISDFDSSSDDEEDTDRIQIQMVEQQIQLLQRQLEALRHKRRRKMEKRKSGGGSRRSSKGSGSVDYYSVPASASAFVSGEDLNGSTMPSMAMAGPPREPKAPKQPRAPKPPREKKKVGRPRKPIDPPEIREITFEEKRDLSEAIPLLSAEKLNRVVQIIHESMPHLKDNAGDEIELDIDSLDLVTLNRLWYFVKGGKKKRNNIEDSGLNVSKISELEMELARMDGRMDKSKRFQGLGDDSASDSDSDDSDTGSEA